MQDKITTDLLNEIGQLDWAVEGLYHDGETPAERREATDKRNALVAELRAHWEAQEEAQRKLAA